MNYQFIDPEKIMDLLFNDSEYVIEFCEAGISSFEEFVNNYQNHLLDRNMEDLRKAGHKIKPGAQMMGADEVVEEYEHSKELLRNDAARKDLKSSADKMQEICSTIQEELKQLAQNPN